MLNKLDREELNCNVFSVYDYDGLTLQELLCQFYTKINECIDTTNETLTLVEWLTNEGLKIEVAQKLVSWLEDGTLADIINVTVFENLNRKIDNRTTVSVKDFGAVGDGNTYDTEAFRKAIESIDRRGTILIPTGVYLIENLHIDKDRVTLKGDGKQSVIKTYGNTYGIKVSGSECILQDFNLYQQDIEEIFAPSIGILLTSKNNSNNHNLKINNVEVSYYNGDGIRVEGNGGEMYLTNISNVRVYNVEGKGIVFKTHDSNIFNSDIHDTGMSGIVSIGGNNKLSNLKVYYCAMNERNNGGVVIQGQRNLLSNIDSQENYGHGFIFDTTSTGSVGSSLLADANGIQDKLHHIPSTDKKVGFKINAENIAIQGRATDFRKNSQEKAFEVAPNITNINLDILQDSNMNKVVYFNGNKHFNNILSVLPRGCNTVMTPVFTEKNRNTNAVVSNTPVYIDLDSSKKGLDLTSTSNTYKTFEHSFYEDLSNGYSIVLRTKFNRLYGDSYRELFRMYNNEQRVCGVQIYNNKPFLFYLKNDNTIGSMINDSIQELKTNKFYTFIITYLNSKTSLYVFDDEGNLVCKLDATNTQNYNINKIVINHDNYTQEQIVDKLSINEFYNLVDVHRHKNNVFITNKTKLYFDFNNYLYPKCNDIYKIGDNSYKLYLDGEGNLNKIKL